MRQTPRAVKTEYFQSHFWVRRTHILNSSLSAVHGNYWFKGLTKSPSSPKLTAISRLSRKSILLVLTRSPFERSPLFGTDGATETNNAPTTGNVLGVDAYASGRLQGQWASEGTECQSPKCRKGHGAGLRARNSRVDAADDLCSGNIRFIVRS